MTQPEVLANLNEIKESLKEANEYYQESLRLAEEAFSKLTRVTIGDDVRTFQRLEGEHHRGLAIRGLVLALEGFKKAELEARLKQSSSSINYMHDLVIGGAQKEK